LPSHRQLDVSGHARLGVGEEEPGLDTEHDDAGKSLALRVALEVLEALIAR
jgi:hypothetical protein